MTRTVHRLPLLFTFLLFIFSGFTSLSAQPNFEEFPWLNDIVDTEDCCQYKKVTAYQSGIFNFIYIEKDVNCSDEGGTLYFENGTFYCMDATGLDCRSAYGLVEEQSRTLWDCQVELAQNVEEIYIVCAGDSVFLPALQTLPIPPAGPANPNDGPPSLPCQPLLNQITISPDAGSTAKGLEGFMVLANTNTVYEVRSDGFCGGPGSISTSFATVNYQIMIDDECEVAVSCENVLEQEWIAPFLKEKCTGKIYQIEYNGQEAIYMTTLCGCVDAADMLFSCAGEVICSLGGNIPPNSDGLCDESVREQLIDDNAIWKPACDCPCPVDANPVCGVNGQDLRIRLCCILCRG